MHRYPNSTCLGTCVLTQPRRGAQKVARGERSEPLEKNGREEPWRENIDMKGPSPLAGLCLIRHPIQGFASLTLGCFGIAPPGLSRVFGALVLLALFGCHSTAGGSGTEDSAQSALRAGDYAKAREQFETTIRSKTNAEESEAGLLKTLRETGAYQDAIKRADEFLSRRDGSALLHLERGRTAAAVGDYAGAEKHFRRSLAIAPPGSVTRSHATRQLAELLQDLGRRADAAVLWDQLLDEYRAGRVHGSERLGDVALAAWQRGYVQDAKDIFIDATDQGLGPEVSLEALSDFGYLFLEKYNATTAMDVFRDCLRINISYPPAIMGMALAKRYENDTEAEAYAGAALKINPNLVPALNLLAELDIDGEDYESALSKIKAALAVNPASLDSLSLEAVCYYFHRDNADFSAVERKILSINPSYGKLYYTLAESLVSRRKYEEAVDFNRKAIALDPELWAAHVSLGMNLTRVGKLEEGRKAIEQAFSGDPYNVWAYNSLELFDQMDGFARTRSEHFLFRMSKEDEPVLSSYAPELAEEVYLKLTRRYQFQPDGPLQVEIFPDHGGFAVRTLGLPGLGGALGVCFGKVLAIDSPRARPAGTFNWGTTLWHEFTHVITLQMTRYNIPRWYSEGLSVYEEHRARPGWGDNLTASFIKAYKEGKLLKASELNSGIMRPKFPEQTVLSYYQAALFCEMIEERFGFDKIRQSLLLFADNKNFDEVFRQTLGYDTSKLNDEYARYIDSRIRDIASRVRFAGQDEQSIDTSADSKKSLAAKLVESNPEDFFANLQMGTLLRKEGDYKNAEPYLKKARDVFPQYTDPGNPYEQLAAIYLKLNREDEELAELDAWSRMDGNSSAPLLGAADIYRKHKDWPSVTRVLGLSIYINPYDITVQRHLGEAAMESKDWNAAITAFRVLVALDANDPAGARYDLARALSASGKKQEAKREVLRALEIAPTFLKAQQLLLKLSQGAGE
jgi:tetratricopeptide (TPR) repeat protein